MLFTQYGTLNMRNKKWEDDFSLIDPEGPSYVDTAYSKAYLHHLFKAQELLAMQIASIHNLAFYLWLGARSPKTYHCGRLRAMEVYHGKTSFHPFMTEKRNRL